MTVKELMERFQSLSKEDRAAVVRQIMPEFCRSMMGDPKRIREMFTLLTEECGGTMANMMAMMGMVSDHRGGCCG
jgi:hypothetical protein